jgi:hypothetical protein
VARNLRAATLNRGFEPRRPGLSFFSAKEKLMRARLWLLPLLLTAVLGVGAAVAEPIGAHWELSPFGGFTLFDPKLRYPGNNVPLADDLYLGGRLSYETRSWIGFEIAAGTTPTAQDLESGALEYDFFHASGNLVISPARHRWGTPYLFVGGGYAQLKPSSGLKKETGAIEFGGGLKMWMTDGLGLRFEARDISFKPLENLGTQNNFHNVVLGAGLTLALGATPRDTDGDGVPDRKDKCPARGREGLPERRGRRRRPRRDRPVRRHAEGRDGGRGRLPEGLRR